MEKGLLLLCVHTLTHTHSTHRHTHKVHIPESKQYSLLRAARRTSTAASSTATGTGRRHCKPAATKHTHRRARLNNTCAQRSPPSAALPATGQPKIHGDNRRASAERSPSERGLPFIQLGLHRKGLSHAQLRLQRTPEQWRGWGADPHAVTNPHRTSGSHLCTLLIAFCWPEALPITSTVN